MVNVNHYIYSEKTLGAKCAELAQRFKFDKQLNELNKIEACSITFAPTKEMQCELSIAYYDKSDHLSPIIEYFNPLFRNTIELTKNIGRQYYPEIRMSVRKDTLDRFTWDGIFYLQKTIMLAASNQLVFSRTKTPLPKI